MASKKENENKKVSTKKKETKSKEKKQKEQDVKKEVKKKTNKDLVVKKNQKELTINEEQLEKIEEEIKKQTTIPEEKQNKINKRIFKNIIIASIVVLYFIFINLGFYNIEPSKYLKDLQVFSIITIGITIVIFEKAYRKDSGELAIYGIESLIISICTLMTIYIRAYHQNKYSYIINAIAILFAIYYVGKAIVIYVKLRRKALKRASDIDKIRRVK